jgi:hypothetical protein
MGRGRAKAKQTKVARELKYSSPDMNLDRLRQDLGTAGPDNGSNGAVGEIEDYDDPYALDDDEGSPSRRSG